MMGHRACRMGITYPGLYLMQAEAVIQAALAVHEQGVNVQPEIMIPLVSTKKELAQLKEAIKDHLDKVLQEMGAELTYTIGAMVETPRACLVADQLAEEAEFFSFGTNDLTQLSFGYSRDDAGKFLNAYLEEGILKNDPFQTIDLDAVKELVAIATERGRKTQSNLKVGVCGELGGDPRSIKVFHQIGLDYVSCSPYRVPIAQLAAAQSAIQDEIA